MPRSENPLRLAFWLGEVDPRPLAIFRIGFGLSLLHDLFDYSRDLRAFLTDEGMLPRGVQGDDLVRILLFLCLFTDPGRAYSLDVRLGRKVRGPAPALGQRALQVHLALLYFVAARLKFRSGWLTQNPIYQTLQLDGFVRPLGALLLRAPPLCKVAGLAVMGMEWLFAFFAFYPRRIPLARALAIGCGAGVQIGILLTMRVGVFTEVLICSNALFLQPGWIDRAEAFVGWQPKVAPGEQPDPPRGWPGTARIAGSAILAFYFLGLAWGPFIGSRVKEPALFSQPRRWLWLEQPFGLFDVIYDVPLWSASGVRVDGTPVDVLQAAQPELVGKVGVRFSRWYKFTFKERERPFRLPELGLHLCRAFEAGTGAGLRSFTLTETLTPPALPGQPRGQARRRDLLHQTCPRAAPVGRR